MNNHYTGRLHYDARQDAYTHLLRDESGRLIKASTPQSSKPEHRDNARRLAACWNACQDVPTHILEASPAPFSALREERDILLSAARKALWALAHAANANPLYQAEYEALDVAFRKAAGSPPAAGINEQAEGG